MISGPPYLVYLLISPVLVIVSLLTNRFIEHTWALLIFSITGAMWRHIEKDIDSQLTKWLVVKYPQKENIEELKLRIKLIIVVIYQVVNIALLAGLVVYLIAILEV